MPARLRLHPIMSLDGPGGPAEDAWSPLEEPAYEDRAPRGPRCEGAPGRAINLRRLEPGWSPQLRRGCCPREKTGRMEPAGEG